MRLAKLAVLNVLGSWINAGQCGPVVGRNGLDAIAGAMAELVAGGAGSGCAETHLARRSGRLEGVAPASIPTV